MTNPPPSPLDRFLEERGLALDYIDVIQHAITNHLDVNPTTLDWANVGDMIYFGDKLKEIVKEMECAQ